MSSKRADGGPSLRRHIIAVTTATMGVIAIAVGVLTVTVSWQYHMRRVYAMVGRLTEDLRDEYRELGGGTPTFFEHMDIDADEHDSTRTFVVLSTADGRALRTTAMPERLKARILHAIRRGRRDHRFYTERASPEDRHVAVRMKTLALHDGNLITVARDVTDVERYLLFLALAQGVDILLATLLTGLVVTLVTARFVRRLNSVASTAAAIEAGDWGRRVAEDDGESREVRALVRAFNGMCDKNERTLNELRVLTDNMAHDLRTPLTRLSMAAEASLFDDTKRDGLPDRVLGEAHGMLEMINTLLDIAQTGARIDRSPRADLDLARLVRDLSALYQPLAEQRGLTLRVHAPEGEVAFSGHRAKLQQLVGNLLENAVKYTPRGGRIDVTLKGGVDGVTLAVADTGCGIAAADLPHIYTRFWRADASRTRPGNGLGLALVHAIVTSYGGSVRCDSTPGKGSVFTVRLHCATSAEQVQFRRSGEAEGGFSAEPRRIMV